MAYAIDREKIVKGIMGISAYMIYAHIPPTKIHYADVPDFPKYYPKMARKTPTRSRVSRRQRAS